MSIKSVGAEKIIELVKPEGKKGNIPSGKVNVKLVTTDSRRVVTGSVFIAVKGEERDGHDYIKDAVDRGAFLIVGEREDVEIEGAGYLIVKDSRKAAVRLLKWFYDAPDEKLRVIGVTGTNGKTTTTYLLESILREKGELPGVIGTVNWRYGNRSIEASNTTPSFETIISLMAEMVKEGVKSLVMEVSSHSLAQRRIDGINFDAGVFTNLSRDHLDYHGDMENYYLAKRRFFCELLPASGKKSFGVVNIDDPWGRRIVDECSDVNLFTYGFEKGDAHVEEVIFSPAGMEFTVRIFDDKCSMISDLIGRYNLYNILAASLTAHLAGTACEEIKMGVEKVKRVPGRVEKLYYSGTPVVIIDYAHTPDAVKNVLSALRDIAGGRRIITVVGAGGDRDKEKRKPMGMEAGRYSDFVIVTSDNPRTEDPLKIIEMVAEGVKESGTPFKKIENREEAIREAIMMASEKDIVAILGKGHEEYQIIGSKKIPFSDREVAEKFLMEKRR